MQNIKTTTIDKLYLREFNNLIENIILGNISSQLTDSDYQNEKVYNEFLYFIIRIIAVLNWRNSKTGYGNATTIQYEEYIKIIKRRSKESIIFKEDFGLFKIDKELFTSIVNQIVPYVDNEKFQIEVIGIIFEEFSYKAVKIKDKNLDIEVSSSKKENGAFYTDLGIVRFIISKTLEQFKGDSFEEILSKKFVDPAMGSGFFLLELIRQVADIYNTKYKLADVKRLIAQNMVFGVDKNVFAVEIAKLCIWLEIGNLSLPINFLDSNLKCGDSLRIDNKMMVNNRDKFDLFEWHNEFSSVFNDKKWGFDAVIGNPPWGKVKANIKEYFSYIDETTNAYQGKSLKQYVKVRPEYEEWHNYVQNTKEYVQSLRRSDFYSYQNYKVNGKTTGGDFDLYRFFLELSYRILNENGVLGFLIPSSFYMSAGATGLRYLYFYNGCVKYLINFENKKKIFLIHPSFKFSIFIYKKGVNKGRVNNIINDLIDPKSLDDDIFKQHKSISLSLEDIIKFSNNFLTIPEMKSSQELSITKKLYSSYPALGKRIDGYWNISFNRELDMTNDSASFTTLNEITNDSTSDLSKYYPLYEGRMVHQYDYSFKEYVSGQARSAKWIIQPYNDKKVIPHYLVHEKYLEEKSLQNVCSKPRAAFCDVTGHKNERTVLATLIPAKTVCGNKVPTCDFGEDDDLRLHLLWIGIANSFIIDWLVRQKITTTLNYFHWEQIPFPRINVNDPIAKEIILRSSQLTLISDDTESIFGELQQFYPKEEIQRFSKKPSLQMRAELRAEIEVLVSNLFNITLEELANILYDFPILDRNQPSLKGDRNLFDNRQNRASFVTRDTVLYKFIQKNNLNGNSDIVRLYAKIGIDIRDKIGPITNISERVQEYHKLEAVAFSYC